MRLLKSLKGWLWSLGKLVMAETHLPLHSNRQSLEELDEAIRLHKFQLNDPLLRNNKQYRAYANLGLAICYYRKAAFYSHYNSDDVNLAVQSAHQAESYFSKENHLSSWEKIQQVLGHSYMTKSDGPRAEHYELAIPYLENSLNTPDARNDPVYQSGVYVLLMLAHGGRMTGTKSEKRTRIEECAAKAIEVYPDTQDSEWLEYVMQMKSAGYMAADRKIYDLPQGKELQVSPSWFQLTAGFEEQEAARGVEIFPVNFLTARLLNIESQQEALKQEVDNFDSSASMPDHELSLLLKIKELEESLEQLIQDTIDLTASLKSPDTQAEGDLFLAMLYLHKAASVAASEERLTEECFAKARIHFEKSWDYSAQYLRRPIILSAQGRAFGTYLYFCHEKWDEAERIYKDALAALDRNYKASMGMRGKIAALTAVSVQDVTLSLNQAYTLARLKRAEEAVMLLEKWRGRELNERLKRMDDLLAQVKVEDLAAYQKLWSEIHVLESAQRDVDKNEYLVSARRLKTVRTELETLVQRIRAYVPEFLAEPDFDEIKQAAAEAPLAYLLTTEIGGLILLVLSTGETRCLWVENFTSGDAKAILEELSPALGLAEVESGSDHEVMKILTAVLAGLGEKLLALLFKELKDIEATGVCLIPCGALALFPLHAATMEDGRAWLDSVTVNYAPSAQALLTAQQKLRQLNARPEANPLKLVGIADPGRNLKNAMIEVTSIADLWPSSATVTLLAQQTATKAALKDALPQTTHLHFACHATFDPADPLKAALLLSNEERLTLRDLLDEEMFQFLPAVRLIVLSACQTALIDYKDLPEEAIGLPTAFFGAGVPGIVGTLWPVDDLSTSLLMIRFYRNLMSQKMSPARALNRAQKWLRDATRNEIENFCEKLPGVHPEGHSRDARLRQQITPAVTDHPFANPYFWAGFIFIGN